ncbi:MAG: aldo/keto reductase [Candidatus Dormibacteria bacterium]
MEAPELRPLGSRGPRISLVGLGTWAIGGAGWGPADDDDAVAAIRRAVDLGVNWIDTADIYGKGHSEELVARGLAGVSSEVLVATKVCWNFADRPAEIFGDLSPGHIRRACEASLRRLQRDHIDLYQLHHPGDTTGTPLEESWGEMTRLVEEGKVRFIGVSNFNVEQMATCEAIAHVDSLQPQYNLFHRDAEAEILPWCERNGTGVVAYGPLAYGMLTGKFNRESTFSDDDWRGRGGMSYYDYLFAPGIFEQRLAQVERLRPLAKRVGRSLAQLALGWVTGHSAVTSAIAGARRPDQVDQNVSGLTPLSAEERREVEDLVGESVPA